MIPAEYLNQIVTGDARELAKRIPDESIDLIWTDPPYPTEYLYLYDWLAKEARRILKPGGFLMAMAGGYNLNQIYRMFDDAGLDYFFEFIHKVNGDAPYIWPRFVIAKSKAIVCYSKGAGLPRIKSVLSAFEPGAKSKQWHHWGQDVESARYYIDCFSGPGDVVLDPFMGGGTTAIACGLLSRKWIGFECDPIAVQSATTRLETAEIPEQLTLA